MNTLQLDSAKLLGIRILADGENKDDRIRARLRAIVKPGLKRLGLMEGKPLG